MRSSIGTMMRFRMISFGVGSWNNEAELGGISCTSIVRLSFARPPAALA